MKSKYKGVYYTKNRSSSNAKDVWKAALTYNNVMWQNGYPTEREAAIAYDKKLIELGQEPVNILKKNNIKK